MTDGEIRLPGLWQQVKPSLQIEIDTDGSVIVSDSVINEYGIGDTVIEAFEDYMSNYQYYEDFALESRWEPNGGERW
jgi:hypothetical protein